MCVHFTISFFRVKLTRLTVIFSLFCSLLMCLLLCLHCASKLRNFFIALFMYRLRRFRGKKLKSARCCVHIKNFLSLWVWGWIGKKIISRVREKSSRNKLNGFFKFSRLQLEIPFRSLLLLIAVVVSFEGTYDECQNVIQ